MSKVVQQRAEFGLSEQSLVKFEETTSERSGVIAVQQCPRCLKGLERALRGTLKIREIYLARF